MSTQRWIHFISKLVSFGTVALAGVDLACSLSWSSAELPFTYVENGDGEGSENITQFSVSWTEETILARSSQIHSALKIARSLEICRMSPAQRRQDRRASQGRSQQDALALGACGRAQRTMGGERGAAPPAPGFRTLGRTHPAFVSPAGRACRRRAAPPSVSAGLRRAGGREVAGRKRRAAGRSPGRSESRRPLCSREAC